MVEIQADTDNRSVRLNRAKVKRRNFDTRIKPNLMFYGWKGL